MTDNEIIKALEHLLSKAGHENHKCCIGCVNEEKCKTECGANIVEYALDLINRQKAEKKYEVRDCPFSPFDEYCTGHCVNCENRLECVDCSKRLKVNTIKEFKKLITRKLNCNTPRGAYLFNIIKEVEKEMVEKKNV